MLLPYPVIYTEDGIILLYFTDKPVFKSEFTFVYDKQSDNILCVFNNNYCFPVNLLESENSLKVGVKIYFMNYTFLSPVARLFGVFEINEQFIIELKAYLRFQELQRQNSSTSTLLNEQGVAESTTVS